MATTVNKIFRMGDHSSPQFRRPFIVILFVTNVTLWCKRSDIEEILKNIPIGIVPGGSGNGLAKSLAHYNEEEFSCFHSCLNVVSGKSSLMDLIKGFIF